MMVDAVHKKFGLLTYEFSRKKATNVGDYIQSIAARNFNRGYEIVFVNRERLDVEAESEKVFLIMNGWFSHQSDCWPPSKNITPLFVSVHINPTIRDCLKADREKMLYFKNHEPIGCRDKSTVDFFQSNGVDAYFSGCLTTTLNPDPGWQRKQHVLFVDILQGRGSLRNLWLREDVGLAGKLFRVPKTLVSRMRGVSSYKIEKRIRSALRGTYPSFKKLTTQLSIKRSRDDRFSTASEFLKCYYEASLVVTSRIHVALPCLAFGTPVLFVNPNMDSSRFEGLAGLFHSVSPEELLKTHKNDLKIKLMNLENKSDYKKYREELIQRCDESATFFFEN